ncbi:MAG: DUF364 domain-containing protein [Anaerolineae bacterium]|nr:DUF364 domain-containing protein [Anaerolineae bacterium]
MSIIDDLLAALRQPFDGAQGRAQDTALTTNLDTPVREVRIGAFWTAVVLEGGRSGLASALRDDDHHHGQDPVRRAGHLHERSARELAELARSDSLLEASVGLAAINALLDVDEDACLELNAEQVILEQGAGKSVVVVGHFPFIPRVREATRQLWVLEKRPGQGDLPAEAAPEVIPKADVVAITGTSLINHTFEELIGLCRPEAFVLVLGPTTPLSPVLFDYGADVISGTLVTDPETVLRYVSQGASFRQIKRSRGVKLLTMTP